MFSKKRKEKRGRATARRNERTNDTLAVCACVMCACVTESGGQEREREEEREQGRGRRAKKQKEKQKAIEKQLQIERSAPGFENTREYIIGKIVKRGREYGIGMKATPEQEKRIGDDILIRYDTNKEFDFEGLGAEPPEIVDGSYEFKHINLDGTLKEK